ncbi:sulfatase [Ramlibacter sp. G-1-2-2]|uniref:Sulfatase n=1 Tax=Ramlibacter agri TaxID=2728837 RepID=A0A848HCK8_9BURK|nr:sulfatase [Ramlibacter agri]NML47121.1 sulfatase [Ramlibacter agri]
MKTIFLLFDSLNRRSLQPYGGTAIKTPNFQRLAERCVTFDNHYVGSLPCMPARRDMHTGRLNFLHRGWGPLEPFDNSFAALMHRAGVYSHLVSDHYHYWGDGGATYHNRYDTYEFIRGQERDPWKAMVQPPWERFREMYHPKQFTQERRHKHSAHMINREAIREYGDFPSVRCFDAGLEFLQGNREAQDWLLHLETFDPHEPFHAPAEFRKDYPTSYQGPIFDFPPYKRVTETIAECDELRANYAAIVALCDHELGRLLDYMDEHAMWDDTALVVTTDHGFLLGEHSWWSKNVMPCYDEVAHIPLFIHHPAFRKQAGTRRQGLTQTGDLMPTLLQMHGMEIPAEVTGVSLLPLLEKETTVREAAIYGVFGSAVNVTDGRYTLFLYPPEMHRAGLNQYTLMPMHMKEMFAVEELAEARLAPPLPFTKGAPVLRVPATPKSPQYKLHGPGAQNDTVTVMFDLASDPGQEHPINDAAVHARLCGEIARLMKQNDAPPEYFERLGLAA